MQGLTEMPSSDYARVTIRGIVQFELDHWQHMLCVRGVR